jgi:hypothetical protein
MEPRSQSDWMGVGFLVSGTADRNLVCPTLTLFFEKSSSA